MNHRRRVEQDILTRSAACLRELLKDMFQIDMCEDARLDEVVRVLVHALRNKGA